MSDEFARLRAIAAGQEADVKRWKYERDGNVMGTIVDFSSMNHQTYGEQQMVIVKLADTDELVSAFLNGWLQEGMRLNKAKVGDRILIKFFGMRPGERFNRFHLEIEKAQP
ncbi:MAG: hypothetical protein WCH01_19490 [Methylococcaceae bacterium]